MSPDPSSEPLSAASAVLVAGGGVTLRPRGAGGAAHAWRRGNAV